ncbi:hypothetical protein [Stenotrophomonas sp.]|uniref:hypothetical protein n=1 Tax=Stenotrophomonas sp. TaxID=69392 RepID=UPI0028AB9D6A|nr:hypothetical protein [Stenotrophomonas sp.]
MYAFASMEPLDQPLQEMLARLTDVLARVHGNETELQDFLLVRDAPQPMNESAARAQQIAELFQAASAKNSVH